MAVGHAMELLASGGRVAYLLKSRASDVEEFLDTLRAVLTYLGRT